MLTRALLAWFVLLGLAVLNGGVRQAVLIPRLGGQQGHVLSTLLLSCIIVAATWFILPWVRPMALFEVWFVGGIWVLLTIAFEFLAGHYLFGNPWEKLFEDYNLAQGRIWVLVLATTLLAPALVWLLRQPCR